MGLISLKLGLIHLKLGLMSQKLGLMSLKLGFGTDLASRYLETLEHPRILQMECHFSGPELVPPGDPANGGDHLGSVLQPDGPDTGCSARHCGTGVEGIEQFSC